MANLLFSVTYTITTPESAEAGDYEETGYIEENMSLRDAVEELFRTRTCEVDGVEGIDADCSEPSQATWLTVSNGMEYRTGARECRSLHFPESLTSSSRKRLVDLLCC